ncbi:putative protein-serine/threonine kinase CMGC-CDK-CRK7-CDK9 family [Helianthus annuus]|nr:putative protein-serine/threonine kinase CMGC-CDK-CRK7-CDK9 family [Helianthus annuus]KAJ0530646.1 putative protein-serine/threonine kinase CMGC-CDK-CRK7-CDK9 family [Helianthus annuus]KAJ0697497.1 putative protein-serine/threonine kinase CMGC-CDK-CRK7-CDK9 family [Helianthus annuus]KAJ0880428.1 putative protein-serine/threonine kinase CMGC-CDK-CRK7-CDK9 family [Helianthus annuus]
MWSVGCILAELLAGKPIMPGRTEVEQLHKIFKLCGSPSEEYWKKYHLPNTTLFKPRQPYTRFTNETFKDFPTSSLPLLESLLAIDPDERVSAAARHVVEVGSTKPAQKKSRGAWLSLAWPAMCIFLLIKVANQSQPTHPPPTPHTRRNTHAKLKGQRPAQRQPGVKKLALKGNPLPKPTPHSLRVN